MSDRQRLGGTSTLPAAYSADTRTDLPPLPSGSIASSPPLKFSDVTQALLDVLALGSLALILCSLASAIGILLYVVKLQFFS